MQRERERIPKTCNKTKKKDFLVPGRELTLVFLAARLLVASRRLVSLALARPRTVALQLVWQLERAGLHDVSTELCAQLLAVLALAGQHELVVVV